MAAPSRLQVSSATHRSRRAGLLQELLIRLLQLPDLLGDGRVQGLGHLRGNKKALVRGVIRIESSLKVARRIQTVKIPV